MYFCFCFANKIFSVSFLWKTRKRTVVNYVAKRLDLHVVQYICHSLLASYEKNTSTALVTDVILEIGPGTENLTKKLLQAGKEVIDVELDSRMVLEFQHRFQGTPYYNHLRVIQGDVLKTELPRKNNFRPPPKVDSSVVRIEPRKPQPQVNKKEWNGFLSVCFIRKNKTLGSIFKQKSVLSMLEENFKTFQVVLASLQNNDGSNGGDAMNTAIVIGDQSMGIEDDDNEMDDDDDDDDMGMDDGEGEGGGEVS